MEIMSVSNSITIDKKPIPVYIYYQLNYIWNKQKQKLKKASFKM